MTSVQILSLLYNKITNCSIMSWLLSLIRCNNKKIWSNKRIFLFFTVNDRVRLKFEQDDPDNSIYHPSQWFKKSFPWRKFYKIKLIVFYYLHVFISIILLLCLSPSWVLIRVLQKSFSVHLFHTFFTILPFPFCWLVVSIFTVNWKSLMV